MAADVLHGFRQWKLWFPCRYFTVNAASITLLAIAMKLPVDLTTDTVRPYELAKLVGIIFLGIMLANFLPSLGLMDDKQLLMNIIALGILIITVTVNVWIQYSTDAWFQTTMQMVILIFFLPLPFSVALTVSASRRILQHRYKELHKLGPNHQAIKFSYKRLMCYVKRYWMMAETGNPQFAIASSPVSYALGVICLLLACFSSFNLLYVFFRFISIGFLYRQSDYKWSIIVITVLQLVGAQVGSIAPIFRFLTATGYFNISKKWSKKHLNVFRVEKQYIQRLQLWKRSPVPSYIPGRHCKKVFFAIKNMTLNLCIALQITIVVICNMICLVPRSFLILLSYSYNFFKLLLKRFKKEPVASNSSDMRLEMEEYSGYVLQVEVEPNLSKRILKNTLKSITRLLHESEKKEPSNLMKLKKSTGFDGVVQFDNDQVPSLHQEETQNCWSLVLVTLTAIGLALPNIGNGHKWLLSGMREGLQMVRLIEESLNENGDLVESRKAARRVWTDIEVYRNWLEIELQKKSRKGETTKDILRWLGDEAIKIVIEFKRRKNGSLDQSLSKFIAASSMYRISQTILIHYEEQENWPKDEEIFEFISTIIADLLLACFTNLPRVITMKCHDDAIEKREDSIRIVAQLLGKSKKILKILKARQLPNIDPESMAYVDKWHVLAKSQLPNACASSARIQSPSANSSISIEGVIM